MSPWLEAPGPLASLKPHSRLVLVTSLFVDNRHIGVTNFWPVIAVASRLL
jgi:hypothetical protein